MTSSRRILIVLRCALHRSVPRRRYSAAAQTSTPVTARTLDDLRSRIGKCINFGLQPSQVQEAGEMLQVIARDWRELLAGSEGFLTGADRRGLFKHKVVWGEMKARFLTASHVNNVVYNRYAESGRIEWISHYAQTHDREHRELWSELGTPRGDGLILRSIRTDFKFPMTYPDRVSVYHKLHSLPDHNTEGFMLDVLILSERHRRPAARCVEDMVVYDYQKGKKVSLEVRPFILDAFRETFQLQEAASRSNSHAAAELMKGVQSLEKASWDRTGAKENFGGRSS